MTWGPPSDSLESWRPPAGAPFVVPGSGYIPLRLADALYAPDPSSELVTVTEVGGLWSVEIDMATAITDAFSGAAWAFPLLDVYARAHAAGRVVSSWNTVIQIVSAPTLGSGVCVMGGYGQYSAGLTNLSSWAGIEYAHATYPRARAQQKATIVSSTQTTDAGVDRAYGTVLTRVSTSIGVSAMAFGTNSGSPATDPRPSSTDTTPTPVPQPTAGSNVVQTGVQHALLSVFATATGPNETVTFRAWQKATFEDVL